MRFCLRQDVDPASYGHCVVEEMNGNIPNPADVMLFAKRHMADPCPIKIVRLIPAAACVLLRRAFQQPRGMWPRRPISEQVRKNIAALAPRCRHQGAISQDACGYLLSWIDGTLPQIPRPTSYRFLELRRYPVNVEPVGDRPWARPHRIRVIPVISREDQSESEEELDDQPVAFDE